MRTARILAAVAGRAFDAAFKGDAGDRARFAVRQRCDQPGRAEAIGIFNDDVRVFEDFSEVAQQLQIAHLGHHRGDDAVVFCIVSPGDCHADTGELVISVIALQQLQRQLQKTDKIRRNILRARAAFVLGLVDDLAVQRGDIESKTCSGKIIHGDRPVLPHTQDLSPPADLLLRIFAVDKHARLAERIGDFADRHKTESGLRGDLLLCDMLLSCDCFQHGIDMIPLD